MPALEAHLQMSKRQQLHIWTSVMSTVEVAYAPIERSNRALDPDKEAALDTFWADREVVSIVELHPAIAREARAMLRLKMLRGWTGVRSADAIHLATAVYCGATEIHTYDPDLLPFASELNIYIGPPKPIDQQLSF